jgi:hypothetical protein
MTPTYLSPLREVTPKTWDYFPRAKFERMDEDPAGFEPPRLWVYWNGTRYCLRVAALEAPAALAEGDLISVLILPGATARLRPVT